MSRIELLSFADSLQPYGTAFGWEDMSSDCHKRRKAGVSTGIMLIVRRV